MRLDDACSILGCDKRCTLEDVQKKYRKLALSHHPDRCPDDPGATAKFQTIGEAWSRFQRWKTDGFDDPRVDDSYCEQTTADPRNSSWWGGYSSWFNSGGSYEPQRCGPNCECNFCRVAKKRAERAAKAEAEAAAKKAKAAAKWQEDIVKKEQAAQEWKQKNAMEKAMEAEAHAQVARAKAEQVARAAEEAAVQAERERAEAAERKRAHEREAKAMRKLRARLRVSCESVKPVLADDETIVTLCSRLEHAALAELVDGVEAALPGEAARAAQLMSDAKAFCEEAEARRVAEQAAAASASSHGSSRPEWTAQETELLAKAQVKFPGGVPERWERVAEFINNLASPCHARSADEAVKRVRDVRKELERAKAVAVKAAVEVIAERERTAAERKAALAGPKAKPPPPAASSAPTATASAATRTEEAAPPAPPLPSLPPGLGAVANAEMAPPPSAAPAAASARPADPWSLEQQRSLETALKKFPASVGAERWDRIAEQVVGKTKGECVKRYKEIVAALKKAKQGDAVEVQ